MNEVDEEIKDDECSAMMVVKILGRKWTTYILCELLMHREMYFSELQGHIEGNYGEKISARVLSEALSRLEEQTILQRKVISDTMPVRVQYSLTQRGEDFKYIFAMFKGWGIKYGGITTKKCRTFSCIHNTVPFINLDNIENCLCFEPIKKDDVKKSS